MGRCVAHAGTTGVRLLLAPAVTEDSRLAAGPVSFLRLSMRTALFYGPCVILFSKQGKNVLSISYVGIVLVYYMDSGMLSKSILGNVIKLHPKCCCFVRAVHFR